MDDLLKGYWNNVEVAAVDDVAVAVVDVVDAGCVVRAPLVDPVLRPADDVDVAGAGLVAVVGDPPDLVPLLEDGAAGTDVAHCHRDVVAVADLLDGDHLPGGVAVDLRPLVGGGGHVLRKDEGQGDQGDLRAGHGFSPLLYMTTSGEPDSRRHPRSTPNAA